MHKAHTFTINVVLHSQKQAELLWELLRVAVHNNGRAKKMELHIDEGLDMIIDWNFTRNDTSCGNIKELEVYN